MSGGFKVPAAPDLGSFLASRTWAEDLAMRDLVDVSAINAHAAEVDRRGAQVARAAEYQLVAAATSVRQVAEEIARFEAELAPDEEAMMCVVGGPAGLMLFPRQVAALAPDKLVFVGEDQNGHRVTAVQHVTQLNLMLRAVPVEPGEEPRRTGFHSPDEAERG